MESSRYLVAVVVAVVVVVVVVVVVHGSLLLHPLFPPLPQLPSPTHPCACARVVACPSFLFQLLEWKEAVAREGGGGGGGALGREEWDAEGR